VCCHPCKAQARDERDGGFEGEKVVRRYVDKRERRAGSELGSYDGEGGAELGFDARELDLARMASSAGVEVRWGELSTGKDW
jgi:hypothetical protein